MTKSFPTDKQTDNGYTSCTYPHAPSHSQPHRGGMLRTTWAETAGMIHLNELQALLYKYIYHACAWAQMFEHVCLLDGELVEERKGRKKERNDD